jgi:hypothetical protein
MTVTDGEHRQMGEERAGAVHGGLFSYLLDRAWPGPLRKFGEWREK